VLHRSIYRGEIIYRRTAKRDRWGRVRQAPRARSEWIQRQAPHLRIVSEELWEAAHIRIKTARAVYLRSCIKTGKIEILI